MAKPSPLRRTPSLLLILYKLHSPLLLLLLLLLSLFSNIIPTARCWSSPLSLFHRHHHHHHYPNPSSNRWMSFVTETSSSILCLSPEDTMEMSHDDNDDIHLDRRNWIIRSTNKATAMLVVGSSNAQPTQAIPTPIIPIDPPIAEEEEDPLVAFGRSLSSSGLPPTATSAGGGSGGGSKTMTAVELRLGVEGDEGIRNANSDFDDRSSSRGKSLEDAVRDAERRRRIDPRTHG